MGEAGGRGGGSKSVFTRPKYPGVGLFQTRASVHVAKNMAR